jgi:hypothetical protein
MHEEKVKLRKENPVTEVKPALLPEKQTLKPSDWDCVPVTTRTRCCNKKSLFLLEIECRSSNA